jgi:Mn-dependent DtxR family transcriptional regulator
MIDNKIIEMYNNTLKFPKYKDIAKELDITYDSLKHRIKKLREKKLKMTYLKF